jgi:hypothetical protein
VLAEGGLAFDLADVDTGFLQVLECQLQQSEGFGSSYASVRSYVWAQRRQRDVVDKRRNPLTWRDRSLASSPDWKGQLGVLKTDQPKGAGFRLTLGLFSVLRHQLLIPRLN